MPPDSRREGVVGRAIDLIESRTGFGVERLDRIGELEEAEKDRRAIRKELDLLAYTAMDYFSARPQELKAESRWRLAQRSRLVWMKDPQAGAAVDLMNDFVFGRGVPKPKAKDPLVQEKIDEAWDDPANMDILTSHQAQLALGVDLYLQSNLFVLAFDDGEDGKVRLSLLDHDSVRDVVEHPEDRFCVCWYVSKEIRRDWDFATDAPKQMTPEQMKAATTTRYYEHWRNVDRLTEEGAQDIPKPPAAKVGDGKVFHVAENRTSEMHFGHPRMDRVLRWFSAYNRFMEARVDMMAAAAAFVMKRKTTQSPNQIARMATRALSRRSDLASAAGGDATPGPRTGSVLEEGEGVTHEAFNLNSNAGNAAQDARMLGAQVSAATRWPRIYFGDAEAGGSLATATSLELPILKAVEGRQELFEAIFRWFTDRVIERAVDAGTLSKNLDDSEREKEKEQTVLAALMEARADHPHPGESASAYVGRVMTLLEAHEQKAEDEVSTDRDLGYEFTMPNPLRRAMGDLISGVQTIAQTFDPNNTNIELSRVLLNVALADGLEMADAADTVEKIFPPGYVDPAVAAAQQQAGAPAAPGEDPAAAGGEVPDDFGPFGPAANGNGNGNGDAGSVGADGDRHTEANPYGGPRRAQPPEAAMQQAVREAITDALAEAGVDDLPDPVRQAIRERIAAFDADADRELPALLDEVLGPVAAGSNGHH